MIEYNMRWQNSTKNVEKQHMERYRSGHNEAVLKTVCPQGRVGSNPTLSASQIHNKKTFEKKLKKYLTT